MMYDVGSTPLLMIVMEVQNVRAWGGMREDLKATLPTDVLMVK